MIVTTGFLFSCSCARMKQNIQWIMALVAFSTNIFFYTHLTEKFSIVCYHLSSHSNSYFLLYSSLYVFAFIIDVRKLSIRFCCFFFFFIYEKWLKLVPPNLKYVICQQFLSFLFNSINTNERNIFLHYEMTKMGKYGFKQKWIFNRLKQQRVNKRCRFNSICLVVVLLN